MPSATAWLNGPEQGMISLIYPRVWTWVCVCVCVCWCLQEICARARRLKCQTIRASFVRCVCLLQSIISKDVSTNFYWPWQELIFSLAFFFFFLPVCCAQPFPLFCNFNRIDAKLKNWQVLINQESCLELAFFALPTCHVYWCCFPAGTMMHSTFWTVRALSCCSSHTCQTHRSLLCFTCCMAGIYVFR